MGSLLYSSMYHYTRDLVHSRYSNIKGLDIKLFKKQLDYFVNNFNVVTMEQVIAYYRDGIDLPDKALLLTFDDGYIDNYMYAFPLLEEYGVQGSFFISGKTFDTHELLDVNKVHYILASASIDDLVVDIKREMDYYRGREFDYPSTDELYSQYAIPNRWDDANTIFVKRMLQNALPERLRNVISSSLFAKYVGVKEEQLAYELYMTEEQISTMKRHGMYIGLHGYDHYWLSKLDQSTLEKDIDKALVVMDPFIDNSNWVMNYPYGDYSGEVLECVSKRGAFLGFTTEARCAELRNENKLLIPRFDCNDFPPKSDRYLSI